MARRRVNRNRALSVRGVAMPLAALAVVGLAGLVLFQAQTVADLRGTLAQVRAEAQVEAERADRLADENGDLARHLEDALSLSETIQARADSMERELARSRAETAEARETQLEVREVRGTADFPIERAMAEAGDTVEGFAVREGTTEAVVRALNPWLDGTETLSAWQTLWIPKAEH